MKVEAEVKNIVIPGSYMVAADQVQKRGFVCLTFTSSLGDRCALEIDKGVALAVRDEIRRVTGSK